MSTDAVLRLLETRRPGYSLPQPFYGDPGFHQLDLEALFYRDWLFAGHGCEIPKPGDWFTLRVGACSVIVVRGADRRIRAFHNTCRHRGSQICLGERGTSPKLVCPYHQWTYELDGRLLYARDMGPGFDRGEFGLKPVHCEDVAGYLFVCVAAEAPDFAPCRAQIAPYLLPHRLEDAKVAHRSAIVEKGNWKLVLENNRECYHCPGSHPELCRTFPDTPTYTGAAAMAADPAVSGHWRRCEAAGLPSAFRLADSGQYRTMRVPLEGEAESFTLSGRAAVKRRLGDVAEPRIGSMLLFHFPTIWSHVLGDHAVSFQALPLGPRETLVTTKWLVHRDAVEGVDYDLDELTRVWTATNDQDRRIVEGNQAGVDSPAYEPGPYAPGHEDAVVQFVDWYCHAMAARLGADRLRVVA